MTTSRPRLKHLSNGYYSWEILCTEQIIILIFQFKTFFKCCRKLQNHAKNKYIELIIIIGDTISFQIRNKAVVHNQAKNKYNKLILIIIIGDATWFRTGLWNKVGRKAMLHMNTQLLIPRYAPSSLDWWPPSTWALPRTLHLWWVCSPTTKRVSSRLFLPLDRPTLLLYNDFYLYSVFKVKHDFDQCIMCSSVGTVDSWNCENP